MDNRPITIFCDIDGTLVKHSTADILSKPNYKLTLLSNTIEKLNEWNLKGYIIILTTGRKKSLKKQTIKQLEKAGIFYDKLIMEVGGGRRVLINDRKSDGTDTAFSINLDRNKGLTDVNL